MSAGSSSFHNSANSKYGTRSKRTVTGDTIGKVTQNTKTETGMLALSFGVVIDLAYIAEVPVAVSDWSCISPCSCPVEFGKISSLSA